MLWLTLFVDLGCNQGLTHSNCHLDFGRVLKGNPKFQGILNWILQILHYCCSRQHQKIKSLQFIGHSTPQKKTSQVIIHAIVLKTVFITSINDIWYLQLYKIKQQISYNFCAKPSKLKLQFLRNSLVIFRGSHLKCSIQKAVLKNFTILTGKQI